MHYSVYQPKGSKKDHKINIIELKSFYPIHNEENTGLRSEKPLKNVQTRSSLKLDLWQAILGILSKD